MAQVCVDIGQGAVVDALTGLGIALVGQAQGNAVHFRQHAVQFGRGGGAGEQVDPELAAAVAVVLTHVPGQRAGDGLGIARTGKSTHGNGVARLDVTGGSGCVNNTFAQERMVDAFCRHG